MASITDGGTSDRYNGSGLFLEGGAMKKLLLVLLLTAFAIPVLAQGAPPQGAANAPYTVEYYYKINGVISRNFSISF